MREERRLRLFENRVITRIFEPKKNEVTWKCRRLLNEELNDLYSSTKIIQAFKSVRLKEGGCSTYGEDERYLQGFDGET